MADRRRIRDAVRVEAAPETLRAPELAPDEVRYARLATQPAPLQGRVADDAKTAAVILAGGTGERFGHPGGKQLVDLMGKPLMTWAAEAFDAVADVGLIVIACPADRIDEYCREAIDPYPFATPIVFAQAGEIRQESAFSALGKVPDSYELVAFHDAARPLVTPDLINQAIDMVKGNINIDGVVVGHPAIDTLKVVDEGLIVGTPNRNSFWVAQTPQVFHADIIREAHVAALADGFVGTDDSSLVERLGGDVAVIAGPRDNIKLTVPEDMGPAEAALAARIARRA